MGFWKKLFGKENPSDQESGIKSLSFVVVTFDWNVKTWLDKNISSEQDAVQFAVEAIRDIGGKELFGFAEELFKRKGASALTMLGIKDWGKENVMDRIDEAYGNLPGIKSSRMSLSRKGKGPSGGKMELVFFVDK